VKWRCPTTREKKRAEKERARRGDRESSKGLEREKMFACERLENGGFSSGEEGARRCLVAGRSMLAE